ncbi:glycosyltransferase [Blastococcus sp. MG754426]|uniref:glycosyltransferase n=1 Tax=Blastococcus sp. MG754426 TaxID=2570317 RepID=UPI001F48FAB1|nr:glycosyltransferase [Blastococcus sp. MG754426]MCF6508450.1 glycosyltransferase [Blastococcus sp. MG754426]
MTFVPKRVLATASGLFLLGPVLPPLLALVDGAIRAREGRAIRPVPLPPDPLVEVVVPAYLEAGIIETTILQLRTSLRRVGVRHRLHVVASDLDTATAARRVADAVTVTGRVGKAAAVNAAVQASGADVIVLTDANCEIHPTNWPEHVLTELRESALVSANKRERGARDSLYWMYEALIKKQSAHESLSVVGEFLAFRRQDFRPIPNVILDDAWLAADFHSRGLKVVVSQTLSTIEDEADGPAQWDRRVRMVEGQFAEGLARVPTLLKSRTGRYYVAHKLYRLTLGAAAFWVAAGSLARLLPWSLKPIVPLALTAAVTSYRGDRIPPEPLRTACAAIALQAVPVAASVRLIRRRLRGDTEGNLWAKVAR